MLELSVAPYPLLVMKFGGTSVANLDLLCKAADKIAYQIAQGYRIVVVVSAMGDSTDQLIQNVCDINAAYDTSEYDAVVSAGENISAGLMALTLKNQGIAARSWQGWQIPIQTDNTYAAAKIEAIPVGRLLDAFVEGMQVAVVAGFQGINADGRITTLGRGGSDTTAVAIAGALRAERCDIYTDVKGVYTADPNLTGKARKLDKIAFEEMLELASLGAKVLHTRSILMAMMHKIPLRVLSSFDEISDTSGTFVCNEEEITTMESNIVSGVAHSRNEAKLTVSSVADKPGVAATVFGNLADAGVNLDMIIQNISEDGKTDITFSCSTDQVKKSATILEKAKAKGKIAFDNLIIDDQVAKVSIVGLGMRTNAGVAAVMFEALFEEGINIEVIATSEIRVSVLIKRKYMELAVRTLHDKFGLSETAPTI